MGARVALLSRCRRRCLEGLRRRYNHIVLLCLVCFYSFFFFVILSPFLSSVHGLVLSYPLLPFFPHALDSHTSLLSMWLCLYFALLNWQSYLPLRREDLLFEPATAEYKCKSNDILPEMHFFIPTLFESADRQALSDWQKLEVRSISSRLWVEPNSMNVARFNNVNNDKRLDQTSSEIASACSRS